MKDYRKLNAIAREILEDIIEDQKNEINPEFVFDSTYYADYGIELDSEEERLLEEILAPMLNLEYRKHNKGEIKNE